MRKILPTRAENFLTTFFEAKQTWKIGFYRKLLNLELFGQFTHFIYALKVWKRLWMYERYQNIEIFTALGRATNKNVYTNNRGQNLWDNVKKPR